MKSMKNSQKNNFACIIHSFYDDLLFNTLNDFIDLYGEEIDFFISLPYSVSKETLLNLNNYNCKVFLLENINRDIGPFLKFLPELMEYEYCCKISLKKSETEIIGDLWREQVLEELCSSKIEEIFQNKDIGMLIPDSFALDFKTNKSSNQKSIKEVCKKLNIKYPEQDTLFSAGTMFWFRPKALEELIDYKLDNNYEPLSPDGTELHALERLLGYIVENNGYKVLKIHKLDSKGSKITFYEALMKKEKLITKTNNRLHKTSKANLLIFVHFNKDNKSIKEYVFEYINSLNSLNADILFISNSNIEQKYLDKLNNVSKVIIRENKGFDFYSYKKALSSTDFWNYEKIILTNDTLVGPMDNFERSYHKIINSKYDIFGMTASKQFQYHIQSFFICFDKKVTRSEHFKEFWSTVKIESDVMDVIIKYELGLTKYFKDRGFSCSALYEFDHDENTIMHKPIKLMKNGFCFFKKKYFENLTIEGKIKFIEEIKEFNIRNLEIERII